MNFGLDQRTALICASTSGLGLATAQALAGEGATVIINGRSADRAEEVAAGLPRAVAIGCDLAGEGGAGQLFEAATDKVGDIDILVLNGPGPPPGRAVDIEAGAADSALATLLMPQLELVRLALPGMSAKRWGRILSISSTSVVEPIPNLALSNLGRAALSGYLKTLAGEVAPLGITVNSLLPGRVSTRELVRSTKPSRRPLASRSPRPSKKCFARYPWVATASPRNLAPLRPFSVARRPHTSLAQRSDATEEWCPRSESASE